MENLLPSNKNIGTTHITNGCYRLYPVEWSIGCWGEKGCAAGCAGAGGVVEWVSGVFGWGGG
ncbi:FAD-dependent oxidoreductase [Dyadobacter sp. CY347]|uniref:FAD-dependent oxidoreductase n=1 Tax=Dyadobacter sp. CY347 TaxID=2909336 RepID=UPI001F22EB19|nr:FAD-dependent oxidoreductase [Dyadobacter sp. CY347]MCF2491242.1 FAD-dependent oxidoreductase [Dyadobacter sp. CY347]